MYDWVSVWSQFPSGQPVGVASSPGPQIPLFLASLGTSGFWQLWPFLLFLRFCPPYRLFLFCQQRSSSPIHPKNELLFKSLSHLYRLECYVLFYLFSGSVTCLNELQKHPAPLQWFQCLFWKETETLDLIPYLICLLNFLFEVIFLMNFS